MVGQHFDEGRWTCGGCRTSNYNERAKCRWCGMPKPGTIPPPKTGRQLRDEGMQRVEENNEDWSVRAFGLAMALPRGWEGMGEDVRFHVTDQIGLPGAPQAWGSLTRQLVRGGVLVFTGRYGQMKDPKSHARESKIYRRR